MKSIIIIALITCFAVGTAAAQSCDRKAAAANGKPLHGEGKQWTSNLYANVFSMEHRGQTPGP
jgi:hypothetical protein